VARSASSPATCPRVSLYSLKVPGRRAPRPGHVPASGGGELLAQMELQVPPVREVRERVGEGERAKAGVQPGVLERQRRVAGQPLQEPGLGGGEGPGVDWIPRKGLRWGVPRPPGERSWPLRAGAAGGSRQAEEPRRRNVLDDDRFPLLHEEPDATSPSRGKSAPRGGRSPPCRTHPGPALLEEPDRGTIGSRSSRPHPRSGGGPPGHRGMPPGPGRSRASARPRADALELRDVAGVHDGHRSHVGDPLKEFELVLAVGPGLGSSAR
jgi:hypothetical protein